MQKPRSKRKLVIIISIIAAVLAAGGGGYYWWMQKRMAVNSYADCVAAGNPVMEMYPAQCHAANGKTFTNPKATVTLEGKAVCLPHKNTEGPQTLECAMGLKANDGTVYGVSGDKDHTLAAMTGSDEKIRITGTLEPSTNNIYDIKQIIAVKTIEVLD